MRRVGIALLLSVGLAAPGWAQPEPAPSPASPPPASVIQMTPGEIMTMAVSELQRAAVGDPTIVDVTVLSSTELMLQAKRIGTSMLLYWDSAGRHTTRVEVAEKRPQAVEAALTRVVSEMGFPDVHVKREGDTVLVAGEVPSQEDADRLEQILSTSFKEGVMNLVRVSPAAPPPPEAVPPLVSLAVQVIEISRTDLEKLGVKWFESATVTEPEMTDESLHNVLTRWATSLTRAKLQTTLNALVQKNKARLLAEPKLVTASGKEASSFIGVEVPIISATSVGTGTASVSASVEFRETGVLLKMTPTVLAEGRIKTVVEAEVSSVDTSVGLNIPVGTQTILVPGFAVRKTSTELTIGSGETILIAGLLQAEDSDTVSQVPALGSMPVLGRLFRSPELKTTEKELVIAVTPELLADTAGETDRRLAVEQALASAEVVASVDDPRLRYALAIQERIARGLRYPTREKEAGIAGTVKLRLHLFADGTLGRVAVTQSSGSETLDLEAKKIAETRAPYPAFPSQLAEKELWLELPIVFRP